MVEGTNFEVGGRYRNRIGWYEIIKIEGSEMTVVYETSGQKATLDIETQSRIISNISLEEERVTPYDNLTENEKYFTTLGYLVKNSFIEAIIPPKSQSGFDSTYRRIKGRYPSAGQRGYYLHPDAQVDKWGVEMRLTFNIPTDYPEDHLSFGPSVSPVTSPRNDQRRINSNSFCYRLLEFGFELGDIHDVEEITSNVPEEYRKDFQKGLSIE